MRFTLIVLLFLFAACSNIPKSVEVKDKVYTVSENISNQEITAFAEDKDGFIWIGTANGLNKFNGYEYWQYYYDANNSRTISGNLIYSLLVDSNKRLWVATERGISLLQDDGSFKTIPIEDNTYPPTDLSLRQDGSIYVNLRSHIEMYDSIKEQFVKIYTFSSFNFENKYHFDKNNKLWAVTMDDIRWLEYPSMKLIKEIKVSRNRPMIVFGSCLTDDRLFTYHGKANIAIYDINSFEALPLPEKIATHPILSQAPLNGIIPYGKDEILFNSNKNGLIYYDYSTDKISDQLSQAFPFKATQQQITCFFRDSQSNLWIGTKTKSYEIKYNYTQQFNNNHILKGITNGQPVVAVAHDKQNNLWIATYSDHLFIFNLTNNRLVQDINLKEFFTENPYFQDKISDILISDNNDLWIKTASKLNRCSYTNGQFKRHEFFNLNRQMYGLCEDGNGNIWSSSAQHLLFKVNFPSIILEELDILPSKYKYHKICMIELASGKILFASSKNFLALIDTKTNDIKKFSLSTVIPEDLFTPTVLYEDSNHIIWIGVSNQGLFKFSLETGCAEKVANVLSKNIVSIIEDDNQNLWLGTLYGLAKYNPKTQHYFSFYSYDGIGGNQFISNSACRLPNGNLVFGGNHGLTIFDPENITIDRDIPLYFENITPNKPLDKNKLLKLKHDENDLTISFVALEYSLYPRVRYYYKMEGIDNNWIDARNNRQVAYSNLAPGHYTFKVYVTSNNNNVKLAEKSLEIVVKPSPWLAPWAICIYILLALSITVYIINLYLKIKNNRNIAQMALREKEHERRVNEMNMSFFNNISHEFRTPLTLIEGPVSTLIDDQSLSKEHRYLLSVVNRNVKRMLKLVNQVLYFNKLDHDAISLELDIIDISHEINNIVEGFEINGQYKEIIFTKNGLSKPMFVSLDIDKLEKILNNILSNALKHSPQQGTISIYLETISGKEAHSLFPNSDVDEEKTFIKIVVADEGDGIPSDKLETIFEKYYQVDYESTTRDEYHQGTGIGLYFTRRLVELHHGYVKAENGASIGAQFTVVLPFETVKSKPAKVKPQTHETELKEFSLVPNNASKNSTNQYTVMVIDDDIEIASYLNHLLKNDYNVVTKYSADSALPDLEEIQPDIILCDVVMPGMSGSEFCRKIKQDRDLCHIPIVLLTAKSTLGQQIEGLDIGANAYITKPFSPDYLKVTIKSQLLNIQNVRDSLSHSTRLNNDKPALSEADIEFMKKIYELLEEELSNSELNVTNLTKKIGMSRTKFYMKMKGLTGENPNVFFRNYKLNRAAELLKSGKYNISEVADLTGFATLSHFSVSFKKQFGINPSEYK